MLTVDELMLESLGVAEQEETVRFHKREEALQDELNAALNMYDALDEEEVKMRLDRVRRA